MFGLHSEAAVVLQRLEVGGVAPPGLLPYRIDRVLTYGFRNRMLPPQTELPSLAICWGSPGPRLAPLTDPFDEIPFSSLSLYVKSPILGFLL